MTCKAPSAEGEAGLAEYQHKPAIPRVQGGNPYVTPDPTVHDPKLFKADSPADAKDVELGPKMM